MKSNANDSDLKEAFASHLEETKAQKNRLEEICEELDIDPDGEKCKAMEGLILEAESFIDEVEDDEVMDAGLILRPSELSTTKFQVTEPRYAMPRNWAMTRSPTNFRRRWTRNTKPTKNWMIWPKDD